MKGKRVFLLAAVLGMLAAQPVLAADWQSGNPLIAHALGEVDSKIETNSREAFLNAWSNGYRVVEADFSYTSDGVLVVRHDFEKDGSYARLEIPTDKDHVMDSQTFMNTPILFTQTPMRAVELLYLMEEYPDVYLVTDTKHTDMETVKKQFQELKQIARNMGHPEVLDRIIPQIYHEEMLGWIKEIHPFENWIYTLYLVTEPDYDKIAAFCAENGVDTVTLHVDRAVKENVDKLKAKGLKVYAHTTNRYLTMKGLLEAGVDGIYTDRIKPYELPWIGLENSRKLEEKTYTLGEKELTLTTLDIFGEIYAPLRQMAEAGKGFSAEYDIAAKELKLSIGRVFHTIGNELLMDDSGRLITEKADFKVMIDGKPADFSCFLVDGEVYAPVEKILPLIQR
ncbi:MAG: phosphatidylinositol-specific phospholipase C/glycerophosphodiester phosphodiesterase family protein [Bacillota bacterium]|nr:phosphatidylinositol-specific phospholipase C/glycerophosphodiester phosphodiesterase family protein [Bacillota bacterium]